MVFFYGEENVKKIFCDYELHDYLTQEEIATIEARGTWSKEKLAEKIIDHFLLKEIGQETPQLFKLRVRSKMRRIMERYLPLIYSASIAYDPMVNVDFTETFTSNRNNTDSTVDNLTTTTNSETESKTSNNTNGTSLEIESDTPQGQINKEEILQGKYAGKTRANESETNGTTSDNSTSETNGNENRTNDHNGNEEFRSERKQKGNSGTLTTAQALIQQYRNTIIAIDSDIIDELEPLFIGLY